MTKFQTLSGTIITSLTLTRCKIYSDKIYLLLKAKEVRIVEELAASVGSPVAMFSMYDSDVNS